VPEKDWFCERCKYLITASKAPDYVKCFLCNDLKGVIVKVVGKNEQWAHVTCVNWINDIHWEEKKIKQAAESALVTSSAEK